MRWTYRAEVPAIEGRDLLLAVAALDCGDDRRGQRCPTESPGSGRRVLAMRSQSSPATGSATSGSRPRSSPRKRISASSTEPGREQAYHLGHDQFGHDQRPWMRLQQLEALRVIIVVRVDVRVQRTGVNQQSYRRTSARSISSIRTETSAAPLRPAPAASRRRRSRRPPRCSSIACRVTSEDGDALERAAPRAEAERQDHPAASRSSASWYASISGRTDRA